MANLNIITTANTIRFDFGDVLLEDEVSTLVCNKSAVYITRYATFVLVKLGDGKFIELAEKATTGVITVDKFNNVTPSSLSDLFDKLADVLG